MSKFLHYSEAISADQLRADLYHVSVLILC